MNITEYTELFAMKEDFIAQKKEILEKNVELTPTDKKILEHITTVLDNIEKKIKNIENISINMIEHGSSVKEGKYDFVVIDADKKRKDEPVSASDVLQELELKEERKNKPKNFINSDKILRIFIKHDLYDDLSKLCCDDLNISFDLVKYFANFKNKDNDKYSKFTILNDILKKINDKKDMENIKENIIDQMNKTLCDNMPFNLILDTKLIDNLYEYTRNYDFNKRMLQVNCDKDINTRLLMNLINSGFKNKQIITIIEFMKSKNIEINWDSLMVQSSIKRGKKEIFQYLIDNGANIDAKSYIGSTPIMFFAQNNKLNLLKWFIEDLKADIHATNKYKNDAWCYANGECVNYMEQYKVKIEEEEKKIKQLKLEEKLRINHKEKNEYLEKRIDALEKELKHVITVNKQMTEEFDKLRNDVCDKLIFGF